jgi:hypothetical protein
MHGMSCSGNSEMHSFCSRDGCMVDGGSVLSVLQRASVRCSSAVVPACHRHLAQTYLAAFLVPCQGIRHLLQLIQPSGNPPGGRRRRRISKLFVFNDTVKHFGPEPTQVLNSVISDLLRQETATWGGLDLGSVGVWDGDYGWGVRVRRHFGARGRSSVR